MENTEFTLKLGKLKKINLTIAFLIIFLVLGVYLRSYHLNFPAIGYHNMKENEYLDQAVFFMNEGNFLHKQAYAFNGLNEKSDYHEEYGQAPLVPYMVFVLWEIFGYSLWLPRLLMIAFFMGAIFMSYLIAKKFTQNEYISILTAGLMTIMPLGIYFGRNVQPESPALFFMLLGVYFYLNWLDNLNDRKQILYMSLSLAISALFKYTFLIIVVPMLFIFPYEAFFKKFKDHKKNALKDVLYAFYGMIPLILGVIVYEFLTIVDKTQRNYSVDIFRVFTGVYWQSRWPIVLSFIEDNYTLWFAFIAIAGLVFMLLKYKTRLSRFSIGYALAIIPYIMIMSSKIAGHSYYQMPFLPLVCILGAYAFFAVGSILKQIIKSKLALFIPLILIVFAIPSMQAANDRVFGTVFYGQDFLGEYLKTRMLPGERFFAVTHSQDLATCSYAQHRCGFLGNITAFKEKEKYFNIRYIYIGVSEFDKLNSNTTLWNYIEANYHIDLVGLMQIGDNLAPTHLILKRGGVFNLADLKGKQPQIGRVYDSKNGDVYYYYIQNTNSQ